MGSCEDSDQLQVLNHDDVLCRLRAALPPENEKWWAFYSSVYNGVVTDPALMLLPIDDHMVHRGHAVFDTCNVKNGRAYGLDFHLDRFLRSATAARIKHTYTKEKLRSIIIGTIAAGGRRLKGQSFVRYWLSAGRGDFGILPCEDGGGANLYVVVHDFGVGHTCEPAKEHIVDVPMKPKLLASMKSNNYLLNALTAMTSQDKGGSYGIQVDSEGNVGETCTGNVVIVDKAGVLRTPTFDGTILPGTTLQRAFALAPKLVEDGLLSDFEFCTVPAATLHLATEVVILGGGGIVPVVEVDGKPVGGGESTPEPGPVFLALFKLLDADMDGDEFTDEVPYHQYQK